MTFIRAVFLFAIVMLGVGMIGSRIWLQSQFAAPAQPLATAVLARAAAATNTPDPSPTARPTTAAPTRTSTPTPTSTPTALARPVPTARVAAVERRAAVTHTTRVKPVRTRKTAAAFPTPTSTPVTGAVTLSSYWVNNPVAAHGRTIALGYVINNATGHTLHLMLGATLKASRVVSWSQQAVNDPYHDVVAVVPPGVSTHVRFFTLPGGMKPGQYDVAWGLRNAGTGSRAGLVAAPDALHVVR